MTAVKKRYTQWAVLSVSILFVLCLWTVFFKVYAVE